MLLRNHILSPRVASRTEMPERRQRSLSRLVVAIVIAVTLIVGFLVWRLWPSHDSARVRYEQQIELGHQWPIDPEYAASFWQSARAIAVENSWPTAEADELLATLPSRNEIAPSATINVLSTESSPCGLTATFRVQDRQGLPIRGLGRRDFQVRSANRLLHHVAVDELAISTGRQSLAILVDCSGSMKDGKMESAKAAIPLLRSLERPGTQFELLSFAASVERRVPLTTTWDQIESALPALRADGATALFAAIAQACDDLANQPGQRRIIVIADGDDSVGPLNIEQAISKCRASDVTVYCVGISGAEFKPEILRRLASETGGSFFLASSASACATELRNAVDAITTPAYSLMVLDAEPIIAPIEIRAADSPSLRVVLEPNSTSTVAITQTR